MLFWESVPSLSPLNVQLDAYEGPLDLLLDLIRKQHINIYDIPIARITQQYLEYVAQAVEISMEISAEFVYMAATLIQIKSKMLLPKDPELQKISPDEDPRKELVDRLIEHERFKNAAEMLQQKRLIEEAVWSNPRILEFAQEAEEAGDLPVTLFELVQTLQKVLDRAKNKPLYEVGKEDVTVPDMIFMLRGVLRDLRRGESVGATVIFERVRTRRGMICMFLAILEMVRMQAVVLVQLEAFGDIGLKCHENFEQAFESDKTIAAIQEEYAT